MITFDQIKAGAITLADTAVKVGSDAYNKGKEKVELLALESKLTKAQRQLGALVYSLHKNGEENTVLVEKYIAAIAAIEKEIELIGPVTPEAPAGAEQTASVLCPQCGAEVDPDAIFCPGCSVKL